jgi:hypothetical protein
MPMGRRRFEWWLVIDSPTKAKSSVSGHSQRVAIRYEGATQDHVADALERVLGVQGAFACCRYHPYADPILAAIYEENRMAAVL